MNNLKRCPFCGSPAYLMYDYNKIIRRSFVQCDNYNCGITGRKYNTDNKAIEFWNSRIGGEWNVNDLVNKAVIIDAIEKTDWYHQNENKDMVHGANSAEHQAWYKADDVYKALENVPSAQPELPGWARKVEQRVKNAPSFIRNPLAHALY